MDRLLKLLGATLIVAGITWLCASLVALAGSVPRWSAWLGGGALVLGFLLLFHFGVRDEGRKLSQGEWVDAAGVVQRNPLWTRFSIQGQAYGYLFVRLTCPQHGTWTQEVLVYNAAQEAARGRPGTPVEAFVRSNDRKQVEIATMGGRPWPD